jgi:hypothetical protein
MQGKARSELAERWDLEALSVLDFEQMLFSEQTPEDCPAGRGHLDSLNSEPMFVSSQVLADSQRIRPALGATFYWPLCKN